MNNLNENLHRIRARIEQACQSAGRHPSEISILAVSKGHEAARIRALYELGQRAFGENYVQEAVAKQALLEDLDIEWHFIGPLQSNKTREAASHFDWVQSVDREKTVRRLHRQRPPDHPPLEVCIQVNIDREPQKAGIAPEQTPALAELVRSLPRLRLRGLMAIPKMGDASHDPAESYHRMCDLFESLRDRGFDMDTLSMGMSADLEQAVSAGSTLVRVGTDLLGPRPAADQAD